MRFLPVNSDSFLIELASLDETLALFDTLRQAALPGVDELVPAARTVLVHFSPWLTSARALIAAIAALPVTAGTGRSVPQISVAVRYDGEDLPALAERLGVSAAELIEAHQSLRWKVAFTGFAPGFAYMVSPGWDYEVPRRTTPRTRIPAGSLGLAGEFSGIYPQASPGGWQLIGTTDTPMWDIARRPPALLQPGAEVRFVADGGGKIVSLPPAAAPTPVADAALTIVAPGLLTIWQDGGRRGQANMGVAESGAMDKTAWRDANRLVGNAAQTPALEIAFGGFAARAERDLVLAVTGADCALTLNAAHPLPMHHPFAVRAGDVLRLGPARRGVRSYLAIRGVSAPAPVLASAAFDTLAQVGPAPLRAGDRIGLDPQARTGSVALSATRRALPAPGETVTLDIIAGPRTDWFNDSAQRLLTTQVWQVTAQSNRIGLRLAGERALTRSRQQELPSEGTCAGAIQVPASGQPVLFLNDHPLTGGYPVIAAVAPHHLDLAGQIPPGCGIRFNPISPFIDLQERRNDD